MSLQMKRYELNINDKDIECPNPDDVVVFEN